MVSDTVRLKLVTTPPSAPSPRAFSASIQMVFASIQTADLVARCLAPLGALDGAACDRRGGVRGRAGPLQRADQHLRTRSSYEHLPFHVLDSVTLGLAIAESATAAASGVLDLGSGSGLPSVLIAAVNPELPVYAVESKSRKTRFLERAAAVLELPLFVPLTSDVNELSRRSYFDVDHVTAKAFKPLEQVAPIAAACVRESALLQVPISTQQVSDLGLAEVRSYGAASPLRVLPRAHRRFRDTASRAPICAPRRAR